MLEGGRYDDVCAFGVRNGDGGNDVSPFVMFAPPTTTAANESASAVVADVCCAASCGKCADDAGCAERPGGRTACCPAAIRATKQRCRHMQDTVCSFTQWRAEMARVAIACVRTPLTSRLSSHALSPEAPLL
jgi:hypothetical protein